MFGDHSSVHHASLSPFSSFLGERKAGRMLRCPGLEERVGELIDLDG